MAVGKFLKEHAVRVVAVLVGVYLCFLMQLGDRSFAGHVLRILRTPEAQELGEEEVRAGQQPRADVEPCAEAELSPLETVCDRMQEHLPAARIRSATVWEGPNCSATYFPDGENGS